MTPPAYGQWLTQSVDLEPGWNGVFLHVDASHETLNQMVGGDAANPIVQVWRWQTPSLAQFVTDPVVPLETVTGWTRWERVDPNSALQKLVGDTAYLVESASNYTWQVKGVPVAPRSVWNIKGLNLVGFPTVPGSPPFFDDFLAHAPELQSPDVEIYRYQGLDLLTNNPQRLASPLYRTTPVPRGEAFWVRSGTVFNKYFGPFEVALSGAGGIDFHESIGTYRLRLRNLSSRTNHVTMTLLASEAAPPGHDAIPAVPPLLVRGGFDVETQTYAFTELPEHADHTWVLAPRDAEGSEVEVVLGVDRSAITNEVGSRLAGILSFTDAMGVPEAPAHTRVDVAVSAEVDSDQGLWVGEALVTQVGQYLKTYEDGTAKPIVYTNGSVVVTNRLLITTNGAYAITALDTNVNDTARAFPLRLIVHRATGEDPVLLQRVYYGPGQDGTNLVLSRSEAALDPLRLGDARRISTTHLPWRPDEDNQGWRFNGPLGAGGAIVARVQTDHDDQTANPLLHTYHPDHDNLDRRFENQQPQGFESYTLVRDIRIQLAPPGADFMSRVTRGQRVLGDYAETIRVLGIAREGGPTDTRNFEVRGVFRLDRISTIPMITAPPP